MKLKFGDAASIQVRDEGLLLDRLVEINEKLTAGPWKADTTENLGENWCICSSMGRSSIDDKDYILTTDRVRASQVEGDSKTDAEGLAELRNLLPRIIAELRAGEAGK